MPWVLRMKRLEEIDRLPVWVSDDKGLRLQWRDRDEVLDSLMHCDTCGLWHTGVVCHACQDHREHAIYCASCCALEKLTVWEECDDSYGMAGGDVGTESIAVRGDSPAESSNGGSETKDGNPREPAEAVPRTGG